MQQYSVYGADSSGKWNLNANAWRVCACVCAFVFMSCVGDPGGICDSSVSLYLTKNWEE